VEVTVAEPVIPADENDGTRMRPADQVVIRWDTSLLPAEVRALLPEGLRRLPPGRYVLEPLVEDEELTPEEEAGLLLAMQEIEAGQGIPWEQVRAELRSSLVE
jgi:hypothetical protein